MDDNDKPVRVLGKWQKGYSGNPAGGKRLDPELKAIKQMSASYVRRAIAKLFRMDRPTLQEWLQKPMHEGGPNNLELIIASVMSRAISEGDHTKLNFLLDRCVGKVVEDRNAPLQPVNYVTSITADGNLVQEVVAETLDGEESETPGVSDNVDGA